MGHSRPCKSYCYNARGLTVSGSSHYKTTMCTTLVSPGMPNDMSSSANTAEIIAFYDAAYVPTHISFIVAT